MGTEVLWPQDCLINRITIPPVAFSRRRSYGNFCYYNNNSYGTSSRSDRKPTTRPQRLEPRKGIALNRSVPGLSISRRRSSYDLRTEKKSLVMEQVAILRRGESLDLNIKSEALKKEHGDTKSGFLSVTVKGDVYAGSAFVVSPSPSALPLPSFSKKKQASTVVDDSATRDLRRLLRLE